MMKKLNPSPWAKVKNAFWSLDHEFNFLLFLLLLILLPTQFGRHFWFSFSYIQGLRLDYLSLTLYTTDMLLLAVAIGIAIKNRSNFVSWVTFLGKPYTFFRLTFPRWVFMLGIISYMVTTIYLASTPALAVYGWVKVIECSFFALCVLSFTKTKKRTRLLSFAFLIGVSMQAFLSILQFYTGGSVGGFWYFFGERMFRGDTPGIANASVFGQLILRPYGTLPHPNVLAAYLLIGLYLLLFTPHLFPKRYHYVLTFGLMFLFVLALILTLSRIALFLLPILLLYFLLTHIDKKKAFSMIISLIAVSFLFMPILYGRFEVLTRTNEAVTSREFLFGASLKIIQSHPLFGVGLYNFLPSLVTVSPSIPYSLIQPVHSIFILAIVELGVPLALLLFLFLGYRVYLFVIKKKYQSLLLVVTLCALGAGDHFFWTLQQGQMLFAFCLALLISEEKA